MMLITTPRESLREELQPVLHGILDHPVYALVRTPTQLQLFLTRHVFAVWDFMSLLKALQQKLTCVTLPWRPTEYRLSRRLINDIVLGEESDEDGEGNYASHFEIYRRAMQQSGAITTDIDSLTHALESGQSWADALAASGTPAYVQQFVRTTFSLIEQESLPGLAAAFTYGREDVIPEMFRALLTGWPDHATDHWSTFRYYLDRHIELDTDEHGPMAQRMLQELCGHDDQKWEQAKVAATRALVARRQLWDGLAGELRSQQS